MLFKEIKEIGDLYPHMFDLPEVVQLVKHLGEANLKKAKGPYAVELKEDGNYCFMLVADRQAYAFGRSGLRFTNLGFIESQFIDCNPGVYIGEVCNSNFELEEFSGVISPNRVKELTPEVAATHVEHTCIKLFDFLYLEEFIKGHSSSSYSARRFSLDTYIGEAQYIIPFRSVETLEEAEVICDQFIADKAEGGCIKPLDGDWKRGRRDWNCMKKVREISFDLECIGVEDGKGKREGVAANFFFRWKDGKTIKADLGKGWTDARRLEAFLNPPLGKVFRVAAMQMSSANGLLRKAKVQEERTDKRADY